MGLGDVVVDGLTAQADPMQLGEIKIQMRRIETRSVGSPGAEEPTRQPVITLHFGLRLLPSGPGERGKWGREGGECRAAKKGKIRTGRKGEKGRQRRKVVNGQAELRRVDWANRFSRAPYQSMSVETWYE